VGAVATILAIAACSDVVNEAAPNPADSLDEGVFVCKVQPVLVRQCSYLACHGNPGTALRVYSPGKLRAIPPANADDANAKITAAEQHANYLSAAGFSFDTPPDSNWLLLKPLPPSWGGYEHLGGAIYTSPTDPQFTAIHDWVSGSKTCN
jgi:hypothetical protein